ncbi:MAG: hypothetical protein MJ003_04045 [Paludibacteraceae bacterium]|nr:hypothetical protein [Paludibacteraceae bacterium]
MKHWLLTILLGCTCVVWAENADKAEDCIKFELSASAEQLYIPDTELEIIAPFSKGSGNYTWLKNGEEVSSGSMSLGEFSLYFSDECVSNVAETVTYTLTVTNKLCTASRQISVKVINPTKAKEGKANQIEVHGRKIIVPDITHIINIAGVEVSNPVPSAGLYFVITPTETFKVKVNF